MVLLRTLATAIFLTLSRSKRRLVAELADTLRVGSFEFQPTFSGRVALLLVARAMRSLTPARKAAIPDYICNIVPRVMTAAGWQIVEYRTNELLEPDEAEIDRLVDQEDIGLLLTASVFGSSALLDYLSRDDVRERILTNEVFCIVDLCQIIALRDRLPDGYGQQLAAIVSFNDKSTPGLMGGGVLWARQLTQRQVPMGLLNHIRLVARLFLKLAYFTVCAILPSTYPVARKDYGLHGELEWMLASRQRRPLDYSYCASFPNELTPFIPDRLQLAFALAGLKTDEQRREQRLSPDSPAVLATRFASESPYLVIRSDTGSSDPREFRRRQKPTYAMEGKPNESRKPHMRVVHNKGYCDR